MIPGELQRSEQFEVFAGVNLPIVAHADAAASKLMWIKKGSHKSRRDLRHLYRTASREMQAAIIAFAKEFLLDQLLQDVLNESDEIE